MEHSEVGYRKGYVDAPTGQLHYRVLGSGQPLIMLHQTPESSLQFMAGAPVLAEAGFMTIGIDTPGFGMSDAPREVPSIATYAANVPYVLDALNISQTDVFGHHTGAAIACELSLTRPDRVRRVVLEGAPFFSEEAPLAAFDPAKAVGGSFESMIKQQQSNVPGPRHIDRKADGSHVAEMWRFRARLSPDSNLAAIDRWLGWQLVCGEIEWHGRNAALSYKMRQRIMELRKPTLLLANRNDPIYNLTVVGHELRPDFDFVTLEEGDWAIIETAPQAWARPIIDFLRRPEAPSRR